VTDVKDLLERTRAFATSAEMTDVARRMDAGEPFPDDLIRETAELGLLTLRWPHEYGGRELSVADYARVMEEVARGPGAWRILVHGWNGKWEFVQRYGSPAQRAAILPPMSRGELLLSFAMTEPDHGTGLGIGTTATRGEGGRWVIDGRKHLITWAPRSQWYFVVAKTDPDAGREALSCFLLERGTPGFEITPMPETLGVRGCGHGILTFDGVTVPDTALVGSPGQGLEIAMAFLDFSRVSLSAAAVGVAQHAMDLALDHADRRATFGKPISARQAVQLMIADMAVAVAASRQLVRTAAERADAGLPFAAAAATAKLHTLQMVTDVTDLALRTHGGAGYTATYEIERLYRDARSFWFEEGTREIQALVVARDALARRRAERETEGSRA
jgi:alkylation response protein AidB-like acyl-CoA dehydrogenase